MDCAVGATAIPTRSGERLQALGQNRLCCRNAEKAREGARRGRQNRGGGTDRLAGVGKALAGIQSVFVVTGHIPAWSNSRTTC